VRGLGGEEKNLPQELPVLQCNTGNKKEMSMRETMSLSLTPEQSSFVNSCVETGRYQSASEVVRAGLRLLADQEASRLAELEAIRGLLKQGADSIDRGELIDADQFLSELKDKYVTQGNTTSRIS
jgi:antitoxin ParD1/3/4